MWEILDPSISLLNCLKNHIYSVLLSPIFWDIQKSNTSLYVEFYHNSFILRPFPFFCTILYLVFLPPLSSPAGFSHGGIFFFPREEKPFQKLHIIWKYSQAKMNMYKSTTACIYKVCPICWGHFRMWLK